MIFHFDVFCDLCDELLGFWSLVGVVGFRAPRLGTRAPLGIHGPAGPPQKGSSRTRAR